MTILPISTTYRITLTLPESAVFRRKYPGSRDIEGAMEPIIEEGIHLSVHTEEDHVKFEIEADYEYFGSYSQIRTEMNRIKNCIRDLIA